MKILITTDWYAPAVNGVVTSVLNLRKALILRGHDVHVLTLSQTPHTFETDGVTYIGSIGVNRLYPGARIKFIYTNHFVQQIIKWEPDIIHSQCEFSTFLIARKIAKELSIPIVHTYHTVYEDYTHYFSPSEKWGRRMVASLSHWVVRQTTCIIAPTEKLKTILTRYGVSRNVYVVPSGIDAQRLTKAPSLEWMHDIKKQLGIPEKNRILLYVGRLAKEKNVEELLQFQANHSIKALTLLIVGDGPNRDSLKQMAEKLGIENSVVFAGMITPSNIGDYYHLGDLFASASRSETQGLTYIEALTAGLPILCRKDDCLEGVILEGINGWQYESEQDYSEKLMLFMADEALRKSMSEAATKLAQETYSAAAFAEKTESVYYIALSKKSKLNPIAKIS